MVSLPLCTSFSEELWYDRANLQCASDFGYPGESNFFGLKPSEANFVAPGKKVGRYEFC